MSEINKYIVLIVIIMVIQMLKINRANSENLNLSCNSEVEYQFVNTYSNPLYRCGDTPSIKSI